MECGGEVAAGTENYSWINRSDLELIVLNTTCLCLKLFQNTAIAIKAVKTHKHKNNVWQWFQNLGSGPHGRRSADIKTVLGGEKVRLYLKPG